LGAKVFGILQKYDFKVPVISNQAFNREIKHVAHRVVTGSFVKTNTSGSKVTETIIPRHKMFSAHTARRSFARHMLDKGASLIIVSKILGHSTTETTLIYAGYQPQEVVSEFQKVFNS
jgi:site-specific recombinase XerD